MPLLPLTDVDAACAGIGRGEAGAMVRRIVEHARSLDGWGPEARMGMGQVVERLTNRDEPRTRRAG